MVSRKRRKETENQLLWIVTQVHFFDLLKRGAACILVYDMRFKPLSIGPLCRRCSTVLTLPLPFPNLYITEQLPQSIRPPSWEEVHCDWGSLVDSIIDFIFI